MRPPAAIGAVNFCTPLQALGEAAAPLS